MEKLEYNVLYLLNQEYTISRIARDLDIKDDDLADIIIGLDDKELIVLKDKKWVIAEKGKEIFEKRDRLLRKLKIDYMYGEIDNKDDYNRRKKELESLSQIIFATDDIIEEKQEQRIEESIQPEIIIEKKGEDNEKKGEDSLLKDEKKGEDSLLKDQPIDIKKICSKCGTENKPESNYCRKCGKLLS